MVTDTTADASGVGAILLAAGESSRLGRSKQFIEVEGKPLVVRQAALLAGIGFARVVVVTGAECDRVADSLSALSVICEFNPGWEQGMGSSLASGVSAMPERVRAALVMLCDQWKIESADLQRLLSAWSQNPQAAVVSKFQDTAGPPAILPRAMFDRLSRLQGDTGARKILRRWKGDVVSVPTPHAATDLDLPRHLPDRK